MPFDDNKNILIIGTGYMARVYFLHFKFWATIVNLNPEILIQRIQKK